MTMRNLQEHQTLMNFSEDIVRACMETCRSGDKELHDNKTASIIIYPQDKILGVVKDRKLLEGTTSQEIGDQLVKDWRTLKILLDHNSGNQQPSQIGDDLEGSTTRGVPSKGSNSYEDEPSTKPVIPEMGCDIVWAASK